MKKTERIFLHKNEKKVFVVPLSWGFFRRRHLKNNKVALSSLSRGLSMCLASNKTSSSPPYVTDIEIQSLTDEICYDTLTIGSIYDIYLYPLVIYRYFKMGDVSVRKGSMNSHRLSQCY